MRGKWLLLGADNLARHVNTVQVVDVDLLKNLSEELDRTQGIQGARNEIAW